MQISFLDGQNRFEIKKPIRLIELFAGLGAQAKALKNIGADFEHYRICEFDKYAVQSYNAIHGTGFDTSDITEIKGSDLKITDTDQYCYIMTYSFPCQDLSKAGKGAGMAKDSGTRSGLLWEVERLLTEMTELPQVLLMENVPDVIGTKNIADFAKWVEFLEKDLGYKCFWDKLNAKNYGIPQNRDRCFMVSILGDYYYPFPKTKPLKLRLKDMLEPVIDDKYYLSPQEIKFFTFNTLKQKEKGNGFKFQPTDDDCIARSVTTRAGGRMDDNFIKCEVVASLNLPGRLESACRVHGINGIAPACNTVGGGGLEAKILEPLVIDDTYGYDGVRVYSDCPTLRADRQGLKIAEPLAYDEQNRYIRADGTVGTIQTDGSSPKHNNRVVEPILVNYPHGYNPGGRIESEISPTITTGIGARNQTMVVEPLINNIKIKFKSNFYEPKFIYRNEDTATGEYIDIYSITVGEKEIGLINQGNEWYAVRKLTPKECFRLMGFDDSDFDKAQAVNSNSQLYKQAGNSIVVTVLEAIFKKMGGENGKTNT